MSSVPADRKRTEIALAAARAALPPGEAEGARLEGRSMTVKQAVEYALQPDAELA